MQLSQGSKGYVVCTECTCTHIHSKCCIVSSVTYHAVPVPPLTVKGTAGSGLLLVVYVLLLRKEEQVAPPILDEKQVF